VARGRESPRLPVRADATYHPALDGLRALAVTAVLLFHAEIPGAGGGFLGVSTFFTLSGFLITRLLVAELRQSGRVDLGRFWTRRFRRLMPASLLGLTAVLALAHGTIDPTEFGRLRGDVLAALAYVSNWRFMHTEQSYFALFDDPSPVQHFWSLSIEEQFYFLYPLAVLGLWRRRPELVRGLLLPIVAATAVATTTGLVLAALGAPQARLYYGTDTRAAELLVGALLALWMARGTSASPTAFAEATGALALVASVAAVAVVRDGDRVLDHGGFTVHALVTAALLQALVRPTRVAALLSIAPLRWLGRISYGVYVYHWPVFLWLTPQRTQLGFWALFGLRVAVTLAAANASFALIEWPVRSGRMLRARRLWAAAAASAMCLVAGTYWVTRSGIAITDLEALLDDTMLASQPTSESFTNDGSLRVLAIGDSVAADIGEGLAGWGQATGTPLRVWNFGRIACAIGRGGRRPTVERFPLYHEHCATWATLWAKVVERFDPDVVVVHTGPFELVDRQRPEWDHPLAPGAPEFDDWLVSELIAAADVLGARGARLVWLTTPCTGPIRSYDPLAAIGSLDPQRIRRFNDAILPRLVAARPERVRLFDLYAASCPGGQFSETIPDRPGRLRRDCLHYTPAGSGWIARTLGPIVVEEAERRRPS